MPQTPLDVIVHGLKASQKLLHLMIDGLKPEDYERQPCEGANCLSWILGHLTLVDRRTLHWIDVAQLPSLPEGFEVLFTTTRTPALLQSGFPAPAELVRIFDENRDLLIRSLPGFPLARLDELTPMERPMFRTYSEYLTFMGMHTALHIGQISTIRRVLGYPPLS